ncbi:MAG: hypothetical protein LBC70_08175 [Chitinispirillales bacterium]|nr:hypothetical protein [Chitinispirillales bacterium]
MTGFKKFSGRFGVCLCVIAAVFFACEKIPEYCSDGNALNLETQFCFNGRTYDKCAGEEYDPANQRCENSALHIRCDVNFYNPAAEFCSGGSIYQKCGGIEYDPVNQGCENGILKTKCGNAYFDPVSQSCIDDVVHNRCGDGSLVPPGTFCATYTLTTTSVPEDGGCITHDPDRPVYDAGTFVTVTAMPASGYTFTGWSGASSAAAQSVAITMDRNQALTANFEKRAVPLPIYTLTVIRNPMAGTVFIDNIQTTSSSSSSSTTHDSGAVVNIRASAASSYGFVNWMVVSGSAALANPNDTVTTITLNSNAEIAANFQPINTLTVNRSPSDGGTVFVNNTLSTGTTSHSQGEGVDIRAAAASGYMFVNWTVLMGTATFANASDAATTVTLGSNATIRANFGQVCTLTVNWIPTDDGTVLVNNMVYAEPLIYASGSVVNITATPYGNYEFVNWAVISGSATFVNANSANTMVTLSSNATITARFQLRKHTLMINRNPVAGGIVTPASGQSHDAGTPVNISANVSSGYVFVNWTVTSGTATFANANDTITTVTLSSDATISANFWQTYVLTVNQNPSAGGTITPASGLRHNANTPISISAIAANGYVFAGWTVTSGTATFGNANNANTTVTLSSHTTIAATYRLSATMSGSTLITGDGQSYRTVVIGGKRWMAENLNYITDNSRCYGNNASNCNVYGRQYNRNAAMRACPVGWHLPTATDWTDLVSATGGSAVAGRNLKSSPPEWNGTDEFGFSAMPGGYDDTGVGNEGRWWEQNDGFVRRLQTNSSQLSHVSTGTWYSVRCVQE